MECVLPETRMEQEAIARAFYCTGNLPPESKFNMELAITCSILLVLLSLIHMFKFSPEFFKYQMPLNLK